MIIRDDLVVFLSVGYGYSNAVQTVKTIKFRIIKFILTKSFNVLLS